MKYEFLLESGINSSKQKYIATNKFSMSIFDLAVKYINPQYHKYLEWFFKEQEKSFDENKYKFNEWWSVVEKEPLWLKNYFFDSYNKMFFQFERLKHLMPSEDIFYYDNNSLSDELDIAQEKYDIIQSKKKSKPPIYNKNNIKIYKIDSYDETCKYGANTKWCITQRDTDKWFFDYYNQYGYFYFIINNNLSTDDIMHKIFFQLDNNIPVNIYNAIDDILSLHDFKNYIKEWDIEFFDNNLKENILIEAGKNSAKQKYVSEEPKENKININEFNWIINGIENTFSANKYQKYYEWIIREWINKRKNLNMSWDEIDPSHFIFIKNYVEALENWEILLPYIKNKDIFSYDYEKLLDIIEEADIIKKQKQEEKDLEKNKEVIDDIGDILVLKINNYPSACKYGTGTRWCIASKDEIKYWVMYYERYGSFYFVMDTTKHHNLSFNDTDDNIQDENEYDFESELYDRIAFQIDKYGFPKNIFNIIDKEIPSTILWKYLKYIGVDNTLNLFHPIYKNGGFVTSSAMDSRNNLIEIYTDYSNSNYYFNDEYNLRGVYNVKTNKFIIEPSSDLTIHTNLNEKNLEYIIAEKENYDDENLGYGLWDIEGNNLIPIGQYSYIKLIKIKDKNYFVMKEKDSEFNLLYDEKFNKVLPDNNYKTITNLKDKFILTSSNQGKYKLYDTDFNFRIEADIFDFSEFNYGIIGIKRGDRVGTVDEYGKEILPIKFKSMNPIILEEDIKFYKVQDFETNKFGIWDVTKNDWNLNPIYDQMIDHTFLSPETFMIKLEDKYGILAIDNMGNTKELISPIYDDIDHIYNWEDRKILLWKYSIDKKKGLIDVNGKIILNPVFREIENTRYLSDQYKLKAYLPNTEGYKYDWDSRLEVILKFDKNYNPLFDINGKNITKENLLSFEEILNENVNRGNLKRYMIEVEDDEGFDRELLLQFYTGKLHEAYSNLNIPGKGVILELANGDKTDSKKYNFNNNIFKIMKTFKYLFERDIKDVDWYLFGTKIMNETKIDFYISIASKISSKYNMDVEIIENNDEIFFLVG